jgi:tRNA threonylcarbamoyladenosine biosynthesis protein TsaE
MRNKAPEWTCDTGSAEETLALARELGRNVRPGDWIALIGDLGSGKTVFTRGLSEGMGLEEIPTSPTFALVQVHRPPKRGRFVLRHVDLYRLSSAEIPALEWEELSDEGGVTIVEWAEKARFLWPPQCLSIHLIHRGADQRRIEFRSTGPRSLELLRQTKGKK